jgi:transposase-like protein
MKGVPFPEEIKQLIVKRTREGDKIEDLAKEFKCNSNTIRKWLVQSGGVSGVNSSGRNLRSNDLLMAKLQREKADLLAIIGELTVLNRELSKKKDR